jgi:glycosyltransferase involved in cell wall biosynthesis
MDVTVALDARYAVATDGSVWSQSGMARRFWERYLDVFDSVRIVARGALVDRVPDGAAEVTGRNILFHRVPDYHGPWQFLKRYRPVWMAVRAAVPTRGAVILRVGSQIANMLERELAVESYPYALEVIGDPHEVFAPGVVEHPLRRYLRWHFSRRLRQQCLRAIGVAYVTKRTLQERYPCRSVAEGVSDVDLPLEAVLGNAISTNYSSIELDSKSMVERIRPPKTHGPFQLVTVGSLAQLYKGTDVLIEAVARCVRAGVDVTAVVVGDGKYRPQLVAHSQRVGMASRIRFTGWATPGRPLWQILDAADLFVLPSRTEGLPRALIEAMARGLPCIGTAVGGVPELLDPAEMVPPGDAAALALRIREVLADPLRLKTMAQQNLARSKEYLEPVLAARRRRFYEQVRQATLNWETMRVAGRCELST